MPLRGGGGSSHNGKCHFKFPFFEPFPNETLKTKQRVRVIIGVIMIISSFAYHRVKNGADETTPKCSEADKNCTGLTLSMKA